MHGQPLGRALFRATPEDFQVDELIDLKPSEEGEHVLLKIRKRDQNTQWVAGLLADLVGIERNAVGFCGLKDRFAVTTQWFSLHVPGRDIAPVQLQHRDFDLLALHRHHKKLRRGMHSGNKFALVLRNFAVDQENVFQRLECIAEYGFPNYFGEQRFGWQGNNLHKASDLIARGRLKGNRHATGLYLSAARSWLFNLMLSAYVSRGKLSLSDSGALWGRGRSASAPALRQLESTVLEIWGEWAEALEHSGLQQSRRAFLVQPQSMQYKFIKADVMALNFALPSGVYATALLREITKLFRPQNLAL
jgi:tRNA pseudouridine13 synthase